MRFVIPLQLVSVANKREHWAVKARRVKAERTTVGWHLRQEHGRPELPVSVTLTRLGPRPFDPDNNVASLKAVQDAVADWLGCDDGDERVRWEYRQKRHPEYAVVIEVSA